MKVFVSFLLFFVVATSMGQDIEIKFIGNAALEIELTDSTSLFVDFPYHSGAYGYMEYDFEESYGNKKGIALFTHRHRDHYSKKQLKSTQLESIYPSYLGGINRAKLSSAESKYGVEIKGFKTKHAWTWGHYSYWLSTQNHQIFITGDIESFDEIRTQVEGKALDVFIVSDWLFVDMKEKGERIDAKEVLIYHHRENPQNGFYQGKQYPLKESEVCDCNINVGEQGVTYKFSK